MLFVHSAIPKYILIPDSVCLKMYWAFYIFFPGHDYCLQKCLTTLDLTSLGVGSCVGTGMYLVAGMVARSVAGPGVVISFIIAAVASIFSGKYIILLSEERKTLFWH